MDLEKKPDIKNGNFSKGLVIGLAVALVIILAIAAVLYFSFGKNQADNGDNQDNLTSQSAFPELNFTIIASKDCSDCYDIMPLIESLREYGIKEKSASVNTIYVEDSVGKQLADKFSIDAVPTLLIAGELHKDENLSGYWESIGEIIDNTFVFRALIPPYKDLSSGSVVGMVDEVIYLSDESCLDCYDVSLHSNALMGMFINPVSSRTVDAGSEEGQSLIDQYGIDLVPTILLRGDLSLYPNFDLIWSENGEVADDGTHIFTNLEVMGTYKDLTTGEIIEIDPLDFEGDTMMLQ